MDNSNNLIVTSPNVYPLLKIDIFKMLHNALDTLGVSSNNIIALKTEEINFITKILSKHPHLFHDISIKINDILSTKHITIGDIPNIVHIISILYIENFNYNNINIIECIRFTVNTLLHSGLLPLNLTDIYIIEHIIESSLNLLQTNLPEITNEIKTDCIFCCVNIFDWFNFFIKKQPNK